MSKLRLSFSLLNAWSKGHIDEAVAMYLHLPYKETEAMKQGKEYHEKWGAEITETGTVKIGKTHFNFTNPQIEHGIIVPYNDRWDLKAVYDCLDDDILYEFKTGTTDTMQYARSYQIPFYFLVAKLSNIPVKYAVLMHYNQHNNKGGFMLLHNGDEMIAKAQNLIDTLAPEIEQYFIENKIPLDKKN